MNETKEKIRAMIEEEKASKRRENLQERSSKQAETSRINLDKDKKKLVHSLFFTSLLFLFALGLFYAASVLKKGVELDYQRQIEGIAKQKLNTLMAQSVVTLNRKTDNINNALKNAEYIENFNNPSWQSILKTELSALVGEQAVVEIVPQDFSDDSIIDNLDMGYTVLTLLNDLKTTDNVRSASHLKIEVRRVNTQNARLMMVQKVTYKDADSNKDMVVGYIIASFSPVFMNELLKAFKPKHGYIEIVQKFSDKSSLLAKSGDASLKSLPVMVSEQLNNTQWIFQYWPSEQRNEQPVISFWQPVILLVLGSLSFVSAMLLLIVAINRYRAALYVAVPARTQKNIIKQNSDEVVTSAEVTDVMFSHEGDIAVIDETETEVEYLKHVTDKIFKAYDIRGVVGEAIDAEIFRYIAYAIAIEMSEIKQSKVAIACDGRNSSPELLKALRDMLLESGVDVIDIGMVSSPILYFAAITKADGNGIMVTGGHNPANYNGMKIMLAGHSYSQNRFQKLRQRILDQEKITNEDGPAGELTEQNVMEDYFTKITGNVIMARPMKIVIDTANGISGKFAATFFQKMGCKVIVLNSEVDGNFPAHDPDPSRPENMSELMQKVTEVKADLGIAFDGDGDRIGLVSSGGEIIWPDRIMMLLAKDILSRNKDATILYDVKSTKKLEGFILEQGGKPMMCQSGHSFMKNKLLETGALLAGEMSGHIFIKERWYGFDDALFVAARILEILSIDLRKSRQIFAELPDSLNTPEILIAVNDAKGTMDKIMTESNTDNSHFNDGKVITIDGLRVEYPDGWGLVRASNTTDKLAMRFEADNEEAMQRIADVFKYAILAAEPELELPF